MSEYRIESRWPSSARWRIVIPRRHGETQPFDARGLLYNDRHAAERHVSDMLRAQNETEYRVIQIVTGPDMDEERRLTALVQS